jgi:hypothetical protein
MQHSKYELVSAMARKMGGLTWLGIYLRLRIIVPYMVSNHALAFSAGKYMESSTGTGNARANLVRDHTRNSARASIHVGTFTVS